MGSESGIRDRVLRPPYVRMTGAYFNCSPKVSRCSFAPAKITGADGKRARPRNSEGHFSGNRPQAREPENFRKTSGISSESVFEECRRRGNLKQVCNPSLSLKVRSGCRAGAGEAVRPVPVLPSRRFSCPNGAALSASPPGAGPSRPIPKF